MNSLLGCLAKYLYNDKYVHLRNELLSESKKINQRQLSRYDNLVKLLISGEDHRFYYHGGFDVIAIIRAIRNRCLYKRLEGASTIEQQVVRVIINDFEKTLKRKIQEIFLAATVKHIVPKSRIPLIYLNIAYYGSNMKGLNQVLKNWNIKGDANIDLSIAAEIVSRIKYPQPNKPSNQRLLQINARKKHLLKLYLNHCNRKFLKIYE